MAILKSELKSPSTHVPPLDWNMEVKTCGEQALVPDPATMQALLINHSPAELGSGLKIVLKAVLQEASTHPSTSAPEMAPVLHR